jgi:hypothetical protein
MENVYGGVPNEADSENEYGVPAVACGNATVVIIKPDTCDDNVVVYIAWFGGVRLSDTVNVKLWLNRVVAVPES